MAAVDKMKIICVMAIHRRQTITIKTLELMKQQTYPLDKIIAVGSSDIDRKTAEKAGVEYIEYQNQPLSDKWQHGINHARRFNPDAILINGSDSWLTTNWCEVAKQYIEKGFHLVGKTEWYTCRLNPKEKLLVVHRAYISRKDPVGAGRLFSKEIMDEVDWKLFPFGRQSGLDGYSCRNILTKTTQDKIKLMNDVEDVVILDIKSTMWQTITSFEFLMRDGQFTGHGTLSNPEEWLDRNFSGSVEIFKTIVPDLIMEKKL